MVLVGGSGWACSIKHGGLPGLPQTAKNAFKNENTNKFIRSSITIGIKDINPYTPMLTQHL